MDIQTALKVFENYLNLQQLSEAIAILESTDEITLQVGNRTFRFPDTIRSEMIRHLRKSKAYYLDLIEKL